MCPAQPSYSASRETGRPDHTANIGSRGRGIARRCGMRGAATSARRLCRRGTLRAVITHSSVRFLSDPLAIAITNIASPAVSPSIWGWRDVSRRIVRRRSRITGGACGCADHGTNCETCGGAPPGRSGAVVAIAAAATADVHVPTRVDVRTPVRVKIASIGHVPVEVIAVEAAATVRPAGGALHTTACTSAATTSLHKDQSGVIGPDNPARRSQNSDRRERHHWRRRGAAREHQGGREQQQCGFPGHLSAPDTCLAAP